MSLPQEKPPFAHSVTCGIYNLETRPCDCGAQSKAFDARSRSETARSRLEQAREAATCAYGALRVAGLVGPAVELERMTRELDVLCESVSRELASRASKGVR